MLFPASPSLELDHFCQPRGRGSPPSFLRSLCFSGSRSTEASAFRNQESSIPVHPPPFLSYHLPHPLPFLFFNLFIFFFSHQKPQHPTPVSWIPRLWEYPRSLAPSLPICLGHRERA